MLYVAFASMKLGVNCGEKVQDQLFRYSEGLNP